MNADQIISLISSLALIGLGVFFKYETHKPVNTGSSFGGNFKKHWYIFLIIGVICLGYDIYRIFFQ